VLDFFYVREFPEVESLVLLSQWCGLVLPTGIYSGTLLVAIQYSNAKAKHC